MYRNEFRLVCFPDTAKITLRTYYQAAHIRNIIEWTTGKFKTKWRDMEENSEVVPFSILPLIEYKKEVRNKVENRWVKETLQIWKEICIEQKIRPDLIFLRKIHNDPDFIPNKNDQSFFKWENKGLSIFGQLLGDVEIKQFQEIATQFVIPNSHPFRYLQMHSYVLNGLRNRTVGEIHPLVRYMIKTYNTGMERKHLNKIVTLIRKKEPDINNRMKNKWEKELLLNITDTDWEQICKNVQKSTHSNYWKEFSWKIINRYFKTPNIQKKYRNVTSECW